MPSYHQPRKPNQEVLNEINEYFEYNCKTGELIRYYKNKPEFRIVGNDIGTALIVSIFHKSYLLHHVVWYLHYGVWPENLIDHKDVDYYNNKIDNLRKSNASANQSNHRIKRELPTGVHFRKDRIQYDKQYQAQIGIGKNNKTHLGFFITPEEAHEAYKIEYKKIHGVDYCE